MGRAGALHDLAHSTLLKSSIVSVLRRRKTVTVASQKNYTCDPLYDPATPPGGIDPEEPKAGSGRDGSRLGLRAALSPTAQTQRRPKRPPPEAWMTKCAGAHGGWRHSLKEGDSACYGTEEPEDTLLSDMRQSQRDKTWVIPLGGGTLEGRIHRQKVEWRWLRAGGGDGALFRESFPDEPVQHPGGSHARVLNAPARYTQKW